MTHIFDPRQLLIFYEKHGQVYFLCADAQAVYDVALAVFTARSRAGWYTDDEKFSRPAAEQSIADKDGHRCWAYLRMRSDQCAEYERLTLTGFQDPGRYEA
jgi:hypothetical protein